MHINNDYPISDVNDLITGRKPTTKATKATNLIQLIRQGSNLRVSIRVCFHERWDSDLDCREHTNNRRAYFTANGKKDLHLHGLELWRGISQSVRPTMGRMILTVDTSVAAVYVRFTFSLFILFSKELGNTGIEVGN